MKTKYNRWTLIKLIRRDYKSNQIWLCRCDCGNEKEIYLGNLKSGKSQSCGCLRIELQIELNTTHGMSDTLIYLSWKNMMHRCYDSNMNSYHNYGGRGIKVCERWHKFENFYLDMGDRPINKSLDRINNDGNYSPENCRWATSVQQAYNRRTNKLVGV